MNFKIWWLAARPKTLIASILPVWIGFALAYSNPAFTWWWVVPIFVAALLIQIGTNVANDYFDFHKGADVIRNGPTRVTQAGLLSPKSVRTGFILIFGIALLIGLPLAIHGGWSIVLIGSASILCGILYTAGPYPLAYKGLSEIFVIIFFGVVAVAGTYYLLTLEWSQTAFIAGLAPGLLATALLTINNIRDIPTDRNVGKNTLPTRFGYTFGRIEYTLCFFFSFIVAWFVFVEMNIATRLLWMIPAILLALLPLKTVWSSTDPEKLAPALAMTARVQLLFGILFGIAVMY